MTADALDWAARLRAWMYLALSRVPRQSPEQAIRRLRVLEPEACAWIVGVIQRQGLHAIQQRLPALCFVLGVRSAADQEYIRSLVRELDRVGREPAAPKTP